MKRTGLVMLAAMIAGQLGAQGTATVGANKPLFVQRDALTLGAFSLATAAAFLVDERVAARAQEPRFQENRSLRSAATGFRLLGEPGSIGAAVGLYAVGRIADHARMEDMGLHSTEAIVLGTFITGAIKVVAGRARPEVDIRSSRDFKLFRGLRGSEYQSFPSGHTTSAFAFAAAVSSEFARWQPRTRWTVGPVMYSGAALVGASRIYNNKHWLSDVLAGAAIGTFAGTKVVRYQHSHPGNWLDKKFLSVGISSTSMGVVPVIAISYR